MNLKNRSKALVQPKNQSIGLISQIIIKYTPQSDSLSNAQDLDRPILINNKHFTIKNNSF